MLRHTMYDIVRCRTIVQWTRTRTVTQACTRPKSIKGRGMMQTLFTIVWPLSDESYKKVNYYQIRCIRTNKFLYGSSGAQPLKRSRKQELVRNNLF